MKYFYAKICTLFLLAWLPAMLWAQPVSKPLPVGIETLPQIGNQIRAVNGRAMLPSKEFTDINDYTNRNGFFDDFSGTTFNVDTNLWQPFGGARINRTAALNPPTPNTVVMDNFDANGKPYSTGFINTGGCDTLLSRTITGLNLLNRRLRDSIYFSFFWQAGGLQPQSEPDANDSLVLQFFNATDTLWQSVWSTAGVDSTNPFQYVMLRMDSTYLKDFTFRFINYGSRTGTSYDAWNIDYINFNYRRDFLINPGGIRDLFYNTYTNRLLKDYVSMPYKQVVGSSGNHVFNDSIYSTVNDFRRNTNIFDLPLGLRITVNNEQTGDNLFDSTTNAIKQVNKQYPVYLNLLPPRINGSTLKNYLGSFGRPTAIQTSFIITNQGQDNKVARNDTIKSTTNFANYFAYDDGSAELSRSVGGNNAWFVHEFNLEVPDVLTHIAIYFPRTYQNLRSGDTTASGINFRVVVMKNVVAGNPINFTSGTDIIRRQDVQVAFDSLGTNSGFEVYKLKFPVSLGTGSFFVGYQQGIGNENQLQVGLDLNNRTGGRSYYNWNGNWVADTGNWALMVRPWFGDKPYIPTQTEKVTSAYQPVIYPNPSSGVFEVKGDVSYITILEPGGKEVLSLTLSPTEADKKVNAENLPSGMYIIKLSDAKGSVSWQKWVKW